MSRDPFSPAETVVLEAPSVRDAREAIVGACSRSRLTAKVAEGLVLSVSEVVTNALRHGAPPVRVVVLARPDRVEVRVSDAGPGPDHLDVATAREVTCPVPADAVRGRGLWLAFRNCDEVEVTTDGSGCTIRLVAHTSA